MFHDSIQKQIILTETKNHRSLNDGFKFITFKFKLELVLLNQPLLVEVQLSEHSVLNHRLIF